MAVDGYLNFDTKVDTSGFENGTKKIEDEVNYPGNIKVNVIRETRVQDLAK